jgi:hypothetical protein
LENVAQKRKEGRKKRDKNLSAFHHLYNYSEVVDVMCKVSIIGISFGERWS